MSLAKERIIAPFFQWTKSNWTEMDQKDARKFRNINNLVDSE